MRRGFGLGERFAEEKFEKYWREFATKEEIEFLSHLSGRAWAGMYPRKGQNDFVGFEPDSENYLEFSLLIYSVEEPYVLARFLVPRDETENNGF